MLDCLNATARTYGTHRMAEILELTPSEVHDRMEGFKQWTIRDAAAVAIHSGRMLSELAI